MGSVLVGLTACSDSAEEVDALRAKVEELQAQATSTTAVSRSTRASTLMEIVADSPTSAFLPELADVKGAIRSSGFMPIELKAAYLAANTPPAGYIGPFCNGLSWIGEPLEAEAASILIMGTELEAANRALENNPDTIILYIHIMALFGVTSEAYQNTIDEIMIVAGGTSCSTETWPVGAGLELWLEEFGIKSSIEPFLYESLPAASKYRVNHRIFTHINPLLTAKLVNNRHKATTFENEIFIEDQFVHEYIGSDPVVSAASADNRDGSLIHHALLHLPDYDVALITRITADKAWSRATPWSSDQERYDTSGELIDLVMKIQGITYSKFLYFAG
jgi:hypothetical protein